MSRAGGSMIYGTAWKADRTAKLVYQALQAGFREVDTAAQPRHYQEALVGQGLRDAISAGIVSRQDVYVQTKYTPISGQDPKNLPYDPRSSITDQVHASVSSSLHSLRSSDNDDEPYLDCLVLHSPLPTLALTLEAWAAMSSYVPHPIHSLGVSNITLPALQELCSSASVKPAVVQNRFYAATAYDAPLRAFCTDHGIAYQSFWTLTGNPRLLGSQLVVEASATVGVQAEVALYALVVSLGDVTVLNGTTSHMRSDVDGLRKVAAWRETERNEMAWSRLVRAFERLISV